MQQQPTKSISRKKRIERGLLPKPIIAKINTLGLSKIQRSKAHKLLCIMMHKICTKKEGDFSAYVELPQNWLRKTFSDGRYQEWFGKLKYSVIEPITFVHRDGRILEHYVAKEKAKSYRIKRELLSDECVVVDYEECERGGDEWLPIAGELISKKIVYDNISKLYVSAVKLKEVTEQYVTNISHTLKINQQIKISYVPKVIDRQTGKESYLPVKTCLEIAGKSNRHFIQDGDNFYIDSLYDYIPRKQNNVRWHYNHCINQLHNKIHYANRNKTNTRLDHSLTGLPSLLLKIIKRDNHLVEIDLSNSQFSMLSYVMQRDRSFIPTEDSLLFDRHTADGTLYQFIQEHFGLEDISIAKTMMMELAFSSYRNSSSYKRKLKEVFPSVVQYIDNYKRDAVSKYGKKASKKFSIFLQQTEAGIFIDNIYRDLKKRGLWCIPRHDSVLVRHRDAMHVHEYIYEYFKQIGLNCVLKVD